MKFDVDFDRAVDHLVPEGDHVVTVEKVEVREGKESNEQYLNWQLRTADGRCLFMKTSRHPDALRNLQRIYRILGVTHKGRVQIDTNELVGKKMLVTVEHGTFDDIPREEITKVNAV